MPTSNLFCAKRRSPYNAMWTDHGLIHGVSRKRHTRYRDIVQSLRAEILIGSRVLEQPGIPRVALMSKANFPQVNAVALDGSFGAKAVQHLAARGRRRIAVVTMDMLGTTRDVLPLLAEHGMTTRPFWTMAIHPEFAEGARVFVELLMQARREERPDGLIVTDDNFVEHAIAGLIAARVRIGEELDAVVHCNFPWAGASVVPVKRLGYDARAVLQTCIELVDRQRRGEVVPPVTKLEAAFEEELAGLSSDTRA